MQPPQNLCQSLEGAVSIRCRATPSPGEDMQAVVVVVVVVDIVVVDVVKEE